MKIVYSERQALHRGTSELNDGMMVPCFETPERATLVLDQVRDVGLGDIIEPTDHGLAPVTKVHTPEFVEFLRTAWSEWAALGRAHDALPLVWPARSLRQDRIPKSIDGLLSYYSFDAGTPIMSGTWEAICASVDVAVTGSDLLLAGDRLAFSLCRPPGHHAAADAYGGYCFLNNAAIAAQYLRDHGVGKVGILDVDYHHGNGTQSIFFDRGDVVVASIHADPSVEYPYFLGFSDEVGVGDGIGCNANFPLRIGADWAMYSEVLDRAITVLGSHKIDALIVSLGVDTCEGDPISQFRLHTDDFRTIGTRIARLNVPTNVVFEGGYAVSDIGVNAVNVLRGLNYS